GLTAATVPDPGAVQPDGDDRGGDRLAPRQLGRPSLFPRRHGDGRVPIVGSPREPTRAGRCCLSLKVRARRSERASVTTCSGLKTSPCPRRTHCVSPIIGTGCRYTPTPARISGSPVRRRYIRVRPCRRSTPNRDLSGAPHLSDLGSSTG